MRYLDYNDILGIFDQNKLHEQSDDELKDMYRMLVNTTFSPAQPTFHKKHEVLTAIMAQLQGNQTLQLRNEMVSLKKRIESLTTLGETQIKQSKDLIDGTSTQISLNRDVLEHQRNLLRLTDELVEVGKRQSEQSGNLVDVSRSQSAQIVALTKVSENQLETAKAIVDEAKATTAEAKATTKISAIIASLTIVLALETYYLDIPEILKMGWVQATLPAVIIGIVLVFIYWRVSRNEKKPKGQKNYERTNG